MNRTAVPTAMLALAACAPDRAPTPAEPASTTALGPANAVAPAPAPTLPNATAPPALAIDGEGLRLFNPVNGSARPLPFGTTRTIVVAALAGRGPGDEGTQSDCGSGPLDYVTWSDGLKLYFQRDKLTGWALDGRASGKVTTASGIGPGSSRRELEAAYSVKVMQSTLGTEFTAGALSGLLDGPGPKASISAMWAGANCNFR